MSPNTSHGLYHNGTILLIWFMRWVSNYGHRSQAYQRSQILSIILKHGKCTYYPHISDEFDYGGFAELNMNTIPVSFEVDGGENVPRIPGACASRSLRIWQEAHGWLITSPDLCRSIASNNVMNCSILPDLIVNQSHQIWTNTIYVTWFKSRVLS